MEAIDQVVLEYLTIQDYEELKELMIDAYSSMPGSYWSKEHIQKLLTLFPEGQVAIKVNGNLAGCALSITIKYDDFDDKHTYRDITGDYTFSTHSDKGDALYGIDVFIKPEYRGLRLGRRLYDYRKELCENRNLKGIVFGGRLPNFHKYSDELTPKEYIQKVKLKEIFDPVLSFQLSNDFHVKKVIKNYLEGDVASEEYAALMEWDNIYYTKPTEKPDVEKVTVRLGLVQWQMRTYRELDELMDQAEFFIDAVSGYRSDFVLFPELFNAPLMARHNDLSVADSIRALATYTDEIRDRFSALAVSYNINVITGSMPEVREDGLYNVGFLCHRNGNVEKYTKIHITPNETKVWGMIGGNKIQAFDTDCGKIGIMICYDVEFPELSRVLADQGMNILFVPFLTDTQNGYSRVRGCAQARAIENECYVAIAGCVGNLPKVSNMDIQFAQSVVFTPCDFAFPTNGIKAEATPNTEMILVVDVDLDQLKELHQFGSVKNLQNRRKDLYDIVLKK